MTAARIPDATGRVIDYLRDLGPRWGLPAEACRVHGYLYLVARPVAESELGDTLELNDLVLAEALAWLADYGLIKPAPPGAWRTDRDPWELMVRALEERQRREVGPALDLLRDCRRAALAERGRDRVVAVQIGKLLDLAEDLAAISVQAQRVSPTTLRRMVGLGGLAARFIDRTLGRKDRPQKDRT
jgi:DNA-binding transcriptional regulator GbsR (MarR family)